jgi:(R,R)-butanediol dehydrogenase/meso-butanediol dehydrogenase/diacetyl reductase/L-iditol 2-dehydrogenase
VLEVGPAVTRVQPGDRVAIEPVVVCEACEACHRGDYHLCEQISFQYRRGQGSLTPFLTIPERWLHRLPEGLPWGAGALLEPLSVAVHAVRRSAFQPGEPAAIFGAGAIGLLVLQVLRAWGAGPVYAVDIQPDRLALAEALGAAQGLDNRAGDAVAAIRAHTAGQGVARAFEAAGLQVTLAQALQALRKGGSAVLVGLFEDPLPAVPVNLFVQKEIALLGTQAYHWDFQRAAALAGEGQVQLERLITHRFPLERAQQAFDVLADPRSGAVKVLLTVGEA